MSKEVRAQGRARLGDMAVVLLGVAGAVLAGAARFLQSLPLSSAATCAALAGLWLVLTVLIAFYLFQNVQGVKAILVPALFRSEAWRSFFMRGLFAGLVSLLLGAVFAFSLMISTLLASPGFLAGTLIIGAVVAVLSRLLQRRRSEVLQVGAAWLAGRLMLTGLSVALLAGLQVLVFRFDPVYEDYGRLDQPEQFVIDTVHHDCRLVQHVARTVAYIEVTLWGLRKLEGFGPPLFIASFLLMFSLGPFLAWTMVVRTLVELPLGLAYHPRSG